MLSPVGHWIIRKDPMGDGAFLSPRGNRRHMGIDLKCEPGQKVISPIDALVVRVVYPYRGTEAWRGVELRNEKVVVHLYYMEPYEALIGKEVKAGNVIGHAQDISLKYNTPEKKAQGIFMMPHIHFEVKAVDPRMYQFL